MARTLLPVFAFLGVLTILSGLVLLIGCANIAGLLIGRAASRGTRSRCGSRSGPAAAGWSGRCSPRAWCWLPLGGVAGVILSSWLSGPVNALVAQLPIGAALDLRTDGRVLIYAAALCS